MKNVLFVSEGGSAIPTTQCRTDIGKPSGLTTSSKNVLTVLRESVETLMDRQAHVELYYYLI